MTGFVPLNVNTISEWCIIFACMQVAEFSIDKKFNAQENFLPESSLCLGNCRQTCNSFIADQYTYLHGKWVIIALLNIHEQ